MWGAGCGVRGVGCRSEDIYIYTYIQNICRGLTCNHPSYLSLIDSCITQLKAQGPSRTCNESKEDEEATTRQPLRLEWNEMAGDTIVDETGTKSGPVHPVSERHAPD